MPFFKATDKLVYYAHVPKCGGSSITHYVADRFGELGFFDDYYRSRPDAERWTRTSPQHVDAATLERLLPLSMFDAMFSVVRHPVDRLTSIYHFQLEVELSIPAGTDFSAWLADLQPNSPTAPFAYDNHVRPMTQIVPEGATVFHLEHGLDALIVWLDQISGSRADGLTIVPENRRGEYVQAKGPRIQPSDADKARIRELYAEDFTRFGYDLTSNKPSATAPVISADFVARHKKALAAANSPLARLKRRIRRRMARL